MSTAEDLLANQQQILNIIELIYTNFKKDGADRKTADYIRRRLENLDQHWQEYQANHRTLCGIDVAKSHSYFINNQYEYALVRYEEIRALISNYQTKDDRPRTPVLKPATPLGIPGTSSSQVPISHQGSSSKTEEMLRKQMSNFKAFEYTVSNINLESVTEKWEFDHILKLIQSRWSTIDSLHWEIDSELGGRNSEYEDTFIKYDQKFNNLIRSINKKLWSVSHREQSTPHLEIPTFGGSFHQWSSFRDLFVETIHGNPSLSDAQRMQFLKTKVKGEAERLIQHLPISSDNYSVCWDILNNRFNNKRLIFWSHLDILMNIPVAQQSSLNHIKRIHDTTLETINAIKNLGVDVGSWDPMLVYFISQKMDSETYNLYISSVKQPRELPSLKEFLSFLEGRFTSLESSRKKDLPTKSMVKYHDNNSSHQFNKYNRNFNRQAFPANGRVSHQHKGKIITKQFYKCELCKTNEHDLFYCNKFLNMTPSLKRRTVLNLDVCENCLYSHMGNPCISLKRCIKCNGMHNTLLHDAYVAGHISNNNNSSILKPTPSGTNQKPESSQQYKSNSHVSVQRDMPEILLATAMVKIQTQDGSFINMRALIDQGSQTSLITENAAQMLGQPRIRCRGVISGVGTKESNCKGVMSIKCVATNCNFEFETQVYIMKNLIKNLPNYSFSKPSWSYLENITLADPDFNISRPVDLLLGADIYSLILLEGICRDNNYLPIAQNTRLGWILTGTVQTLQCNVVINNIEEIQKFWEIEDIYEESPLSTENQQCIDYYKSSTTRREDGRYQVRLPMKPDFSNKLGESRFKAIAQFKSLEQKLIKNETIQLQYKSFINEYRSLGHMIPATGNAKPDCFNTHHCVRADLNINNSKFRVVFNASCKTTSGNSLNDVMQCGPNLQQDLQCLIIGWRQYQFAFTADIEKMFRQIWIHPDDQKLLKIVWRDTTSEPIKDYQLTTVTYGTKAAPFLAMMTLKQLACDERNNYQNSSAIEVLQSSFYMDDVVHGCHSVAEAKQLQNDLIKLLSSGGFHLRKWKSNTSELIQDEESTTTGSGDFNFKLSEAPKTLGLGWNPKEDVFTFQSCIEPEVTRVTKRTLLSNISKLFDPLGWLSPLSTKLKIMFQQVWSANIKWDDPIPDYLYVEWTKIRDDIVNIQDIRLPRWIQTQRSESIELHGFSDSSLKAYACVIYCRINKCDKSSIVLLVGKTRLVPKNKSVTLPRLELSGALLHSKLMAKVKNCLLGHDIKTYGWVDSTVVLGWLNGDAARWKTFVANRVQRITEVMPSECWRYVKSEENPADCASRGLLASQLKEHTLWWHGPSWLSKYNNDQNEKMEYSTNQELKLSKVNLVIQRKSDSIIQSILSRYSTFHKARRVVAWILRFISIKNNKCNYLSVGELKQATFLIIRNVQQLSFETELTDIKTTNKIHKSSKICELNPYLDKNNILRVGGRLRHSNLDPEMKNPIIIPGNSRLGELLIDQAHELCYHGGARLTSGYLRQKYWIVGGYRAVKKRVRQCIKCRTQNPSKHYQIMGDLPSARVNPTRPFYHVGVDYTGHVFIKANPGRGTKITKGYVAVFTCMATKAVHLELVSDLTSTAFLAALRRMSARRGTPGHIYSDNGTNFVGANKILQQQYEELLKVFNNQFQSEVAEMGIVWHFNAPSWPSACGLSEAAVKSLKFHLKRVVGDQKLTYEEFSTILSQLEACLNSRPLCALTEDPEDVNYLTPSHFLSSGPILSIYETERDLRTRWYLTQTIFRDIWKRWQHEYLTSLSARSKWRQPQNNIKLNDIVVIQDSNLPPGKWALGRVVELHPGLDGYVRVVTIKTKNGLIKRPIVKLSILPINHEESSSPKTPKQTNKKYNFATVATCILLFFMTLFTNTLASYNNTQLQNSSTLFFDDIAKMHLIGDDWRLVVYYDMNPYWQGAAASLKYIEYLETICTKIRDRSHCDGVMYQLNHEYSEIQHYNGLLLDQHFDGHARKRRGLINGIGNIANQLFGVLDSNFAEKYEKDIELLRGNQQHLAALWKNQTSVVEAEFNLIKRAEFIMEKHHKLVTKKINEIESVIGVLQSEIQNNSFFNEFTLSAMITNNLLSKLKTIQGYLLDTITDVFHGKFNIHLLTPSQLEQELNIISSHLSKDFSLPTDHENLSNIYKLLKIKARISKKFLIFEILIPLVTRDSYNVYRIIPIPKQSGSNMINIVPVSEYLSININKDLFLSLSETDLKECIDQDVNTLLCRFNKPVFHLYNDMSLCKKQDALENCKTEVNTCQSIFVPIHHLNTYFYFCCNTCYFKIICLETSTAIQLTHTGLLTTDPGCLIKSDDFYFQSHREAVSKINIKPHINSYKLSPINNLINLSLTELPASEGSDTIYENQASDIHKQIENLKRKELNTYSMSYHDIHHYAVMYVIVATMGAVGGYYVWRRCRRANGSPQQQPEGVCDSARGALPEHCSSVSARQRVLPERGSSESVLKRWASVRVKKSDRSTSPIHFKSTSPSQ